MERMLCLALVVCAAGYVHAVDLKGLCSSSDQCSAGLVCQFGTCRAKIGSNCTTPTSNDECVQNISCVAANTPCACPTGQVASANNTNCVANNIGSRCAKDTECPENGMCDLAKKTCECKANFVRDYDSTTCKKVVGQSCSAAADCAENSECKTTCGCKTGFSVNNGRCAKTVGSSCMANSDCSLTAECPAGGTNRTCVCLGLYVLDTTTSFCKTSKATVLSGSILAALMLVMTSLAL